jgi:hypothetical protein
MSVMRRFSVLAVTMVIAVTGLALIAGPVAAAGTVEVTQDNVGVDWFTADTRAGGAVTFVNGPATAPLGDGSAMFTTTDSMGGSSQAKAQLVNYGYIGTALADIDELSYSAYRSSSSTNSAAQTISLNIEVDYVGDGSSYTTLVFEPVYQPGGVGAMMTDTWQSWDAYAAGAAVWWSTKDIPGVCAFNCFVPWSTVLASNPSAKVVGFLGFNVGSGWVGDFSGNADALAVGISGDTTTYDLERAKLPAEAKDAVIDDLTDLLPTGDAKDDGKIAKAIEALVKSRAPELWIDDTTLDPKDGKKVFDEEKKAVKELMKVENTDVSGAVDAIVGADEGLAQKAIDDAQAAIDELVALGLDADKAQKYLDKALEEFAKAADELADGKDDKAIDKYKKAWEYAQKAIEKAQKELDDAGAVAVFDSIPAVFPGSFPSLGYEATSTDEFGDHVAFAGSSVRSLQTIDLSLTNWACENDGTRLSSEACVSTPGSSFSHPITLNLYEVDNSGANPAPGALIGTVTETFDIPFRPSWDSVNCAAGDPVSDDPFGGTWYDPVLGACVHGYAFTITFDFASLGIELPDEVIYGVAYNTANHGDAPIGAAGPYSSLNVSVTADAPSIGTDVEVGTMFWDTSFGPFYCDGGAGGTDTFRRDAGCWGTYTGVIRFNATS